MRITVLQRGKLKDRHIEALRDEYVKRFRRFGTLHIIERETKDSEALWPKTTAYRIVCDERGDQVTSPQLAQRLAQAAMQHGDIHIAIGDGYGHSQQTLTACDWQWSLGRLVLPHRLAHVVVVEQCYLQHHRSESAHRDPPTPETKSADE